MGQFLKRNLLLLGLVASVIVWNGCFALSSYRTAKTLEPGIGEVGTAYTATRISRGEQTVTASDSSGNTASATTEARSFFLPNGLAEIWGAVGVVENLEVTFRAALHSAYFEGGVNYRVLGSKDSAHHLSIAPAIGGRALLFFEGFSAKLPVLYTYVVNPRFNETVGGFMDYNYITLTEGFGDGGSDSTSLFTGNTLSAGANLQLRFTGDTFYIGPVFEYSHSVADFGDDNFSISSGYDLFFVGIVSGWYLGVEEQHLQRQDEQLDRIEEKLDNMNEQQEP